MSEMTTAVHAKRRPEGLIAAWLCLIIAGTTTVTFNVWNAFHSGMVWPVAVLVGISPVALAMVVSHLVATCHAGTFLKTVTFAVMVGAMVLSVRATGVVVAPAEGRLWWLFGAVIDTAALVALQLLLSIKTRAAQTAARQAEAAAHAADERTALQAELQTARADAETAWLAASEAERREAESARAAAQAAEEAEKLAARLAAEKAKRTRTKVPNAGGRKAPNGTANAAPVTTVPEDFDARTQALEVWLGNPKISGKDLGAAVGLGERWGQLRKNEFATASNGQRPEGGRLT